MFIPPVLRLRPTWSPNKRGEHSAGRGRMSDGQFRLLVFAGLVAGVKRMNRARPLLSMCVMAILMEHSRTRCSTPAQSSRKSHL
jgi:hypothetical protein